VVAVAPQLQAVPAELAAVAAVILVLPLAQMEPQTRAVVVAEEVTQDLIKCLVVVVLAS
jgi:hypothetical protein